MSDEDEPAPSPSATMVARRASREAKSMREESGCDEDTSSDEADEKGYRGKVNFIPVCGPAPAASIVDRRSIAAKLREAK